MEVADTIEGTVDGRKVRLRYRKVFVWSEWKARQAASTRERHTAKIQEQFEMVQRNLGKYKLKTKEAILRRLEAAKAKYTEGTLFKYDLKEDRQGRFQLTWKINKQALARKKKLEGVFVLKANLPKRGYTAARPSALVFPGTSGPRRGAL